MIRVALLDPHPALRAGLEVILARQTDMVHVGSAMSRTQLRTLLPVAAPDILVVGGDGPSETLALCLRLPGLASQTRIVVYLADAGPRVAVPVAFAGIHGLVDKTADVDILLETIRAAARGESAVPPITVSLKRRAASRLPPRDRAILAMRLAKTPTRDIAATLGMDLENLERRSLEIVKRLGDGDPPRAPDDAADQWPYPALPRTTTGTTAPLALTA